MPNPLRTTSNKKGFYVLKNAPHHDIAGKHFDYIVVGGGAAGCIVAARLSERADRNVLLLEAGPPAVRAGPGSPP